MITTVHGGVPKHIRDHHGVFTEKQGDSPQTKLLAAKTRVFQLKELHAQAQRTFREAIEDDQPHDLQALKSDVHRLARELETATGQQRQWEDVCAQIAKADRSRQFDEKLIQAREARAKFAEAYREACLALGQWYSLGADIRELVNQLSDRLPSGGVYRPPDLTEALAELDADPNPLPALKDGGLGEITTHASWRRHVVVVPLKEKGEMQ